MNSLRDAYLECSDGRDFNHNAISRYGRRSIFKSIQDLQVASKIEIESPCFGAPLCCMDIDKYQNRFSLIGSSDGKVSLFDLQSSFKSYFRKAGPIKRKKFRKGHESGITSIQWYPKDCGAFCTGSFDKKIKLWDTETFTPAVTFDFECSVLCCRMHFDGHIIASGGANNEIRICDLNSGSNSHVLIGHRREVMALDFCPSNPNIIASCSKDKTVKIWDLRKGSTTAVLLSLDWRQDNTMLSNKQSSTSNISASLWNWNKESAAVAHDGGVFSLKFLSSGMQLLTAGADGNVRSWDPWSGKLLNTFSKVCTNANIIGFDMEIASSLPGYSEDDLLFVPAQKEGQISMINYDKFHQYQNYKTPNKLQGHISMVRGIKYLPFHRKLVSVAMDGMMLLWEPVNKYLEDFRDSDFTGPDPSESDLTSRKRLRNGENESFNDVDTWSEEDESQEISRARPSRRGFLPPIIQLMLDNDLTNEI